MSKSLIEALRDDGRISVLKFFNRLIGDGKGRKERSIAEIYEKVKDYFKDFNIEVKEKFTKFGEYVRDQYQKTLDKSKTKAENIKKIAQQVKSILSVKYISTFKNKTCSIKCFRNQLQLTYTP